MHTRENAWELLCEYTKGESLRKHALAVETAMRAAAAHYGGPDADVVIHATPKDGGLEADEVKFSSPGSNKVAAAVPKPKS